MIKIIILLLLISLALISDIRTYKIKNKIILTFLFLGFGINVITDGLQGIKVSLMGAIIPILILIVLFVLRMLGAGDIKLFSAIGSIMGTRFVLYSIAYSFLAGGVISLIIILFRKNGIARLKHLWEYLKTSILTMLIQPYTDFEDKEDRGKFRFAYGIFIGTILTLII